jgi:lysophospholipase L1-like esterase
MKGFTYGEISRAMVVITVLIAVKAAHAVGWPPGMDRGWTGEVVSTLSNRGLNKEAREALTAGYYEGLLNEGSRLSTMNRFVLDNRRPSWEDNKRPDLRQTNDFLYSEHIPNKVTPDYEDGRFKYMLPSNSAGLGDKEYPLAKPAGAWRIALMGDSITRGLGAPPGANYESLLEDALNEARPSADAVRYEILNFAVGGYHLTQQLEATKVKATPFKPDVYVVALSNLSVYRRWHGHFSTLMYAGIDLKYDFLKNMVQEARLTPKDPIGVFDARLARYRIPTIRWALTEIRDYAAAQGAKLIVILVPTSEEPKMLAEAFLGVPEVIADLQLPVINLLDTFANMDLATVRVSDGDRHPNAIGHRLLFERIQAKLNADPALKAALTGFGSEK